MDSTSPPPSQSKNELYLTLLILGYAALYTTLSWLRFSTFHAQIDMSYYIRVIWGMGHGHPEVPLVRAPHHLGLHLEPIVWPFAALSALGIPLAPMLLAFQSFAVAYLALPAYRLARRHLAEGWPAILIALCALLFPTVTVATLHDFHPNTVALAPLLGLVDTLSEADTTADPALRRKLTLRALALGGLALLCREDVALQLAALCLVLQLAHIRPLYRGMLLALTLLLLAYFFIYVLWIQPRYLPPFGSYGLHFRIGGVARSAKDLVHLMLTSPGTIFRHVLSGDRPLYLWVLLWPFGLLSVLSPRYLVPALPIIGINLLSDFPRVRTIEAHYTTAIVPFVIGTGILGAGVLRRLLSTSRFSRFATTIPLVLITLSVGVAHVRHGASPLSVKSRRFHFADFVDGPSANKARAALALAEVQNPKASVAARPGLLCHVAERRRFVSPPEYVDGLPVAVVLLVDPDLPWPQGPLVKTYDVAH